MADDGIKTKVGVQGDKEYKQALADIGRQLQVLNTDMKASQSAFGSQATSMAGMQDKLSKLQAIYDAQQEKVNILTEQLGKARNEYGEGSKQADNLRIALNKATAQMNGTKGQIDVTESGLKTLAAAQETAETLVESLQKGKKEGGGGSDQFFQTSAVNFLASCIFFFINYKRMPYDEKGNQLWPEYEEDKETHHRKLTGRVFDTEAHRDAAEEALKIGISISTGLVTPAYWLGKYSDMPHVLSFLNHDYAEIFEILKTDPEVYPLLGPFMTAYENKAMEQLEGMIGTLRVQISRLATKEAYWIFHKDGDDFDLKVSDPEHPSYLLIANDPEKESIIGALNAMILNRLVTRVNSGQGKNIPVSIIVDELPTLYFHKIDNLIATARSNKVCVLLGFQELPQLEANYGKTNMEKITATIGNVISGSARNKETLEWLSNDIMGKTIQLKKNLSIDEAKTSVSFNEGLENMLPPSKIADMATGWLCGPTARDFSVTKTGPGGSMNIQESEEFKTTKFFCKTDFNMAELKQEDKNIEAMIERRVQNEIAKHEANGPLTEAQKKAIRKDTHIFNKFYDFKTKAAREQRLYANFNKVNQEVIDMINEIQTEFKKE